MMNETKQDSRLTGKCWYCEQRDGRHVEACPYPSQDAEQMKLWRDGYNAGNHGSDRRHGYWESVPLDEYLRYLDKHPEGCDTEVWRIGFRCGKFHLDVELDGAPDAHEYFGATEWDYHNYPWRSQS